MRLASENFERKVEFRSNAVIFSANSVLLRSILWRRIGASETIKSNEKIQQPNENFLMSALR